MTILDEKYTPEKRCDAIVEHQSGTLTALAGPGTGKTRALRKRVRELTVNRGIDAGAVAYVTFIREITRKFEEDLEDEFGGKVGVPGIRVSTLHGLAFGLLTNMGKAIGIVGHQEPLRVDYGEDIVARPLQNDIVALLKDRGVSIGVTGVRAALASAKEAWQEGIDEPDLSGDERTALDVYIRLANAYQALDWDQVVMYANRICQALGVLPDWVLAMKHFLIDEYQDFNPSEQQFLDNITRHADSVVITGDDDQSLYGGRGANPGAIVALHSDPDLDHVNLVYSWRCPSGILDYANRYLRWMRDEPRELKARKEGGRIEAYTLKSAKAEAEYLANRLGALLASQGDEARAEDRVACLFPTREVLGQYERVLENHEIPCVVPKAGEATDDERWLRVLMRLAHLRQQPLLERVVLRKFPEIQANHTLDCLKMLAGGGGSVRDVVCACADGGAWSSSAVSAANAYCMFVDALTSHDPEQVASCLESTLGDSAGITAERVNRFLKEAENDLEDAVGAVLSDLADPTTGCEVPDSGPPVELYTMVGAKGLTRRYVFLPGCEEMFLPRRAAGIDPEEEKRLFYVAVTRAKELVVITSPWSRTGDDQLCKGRVTKRRISPFVARLGVPIARVMN